MTVMSAAAPNGPTPVPVAAPSEPVVLGFTCNWCSYRAADLAGTARTKYPPNVRLIRLMCAGRLEPEFVLQALARGADAVLVTGCWPADCHYRIQNVKALRRFLLLRRMLIEMGMEPARLQRFYASAAEGQRLADEFARIVNEVRALGPLRWRPPDAEPAAAAAEVAEGAADPVGVAADPVGVAADPAGVAS